VDDFARFTSDERQLYFEQAAAQLGMSAQVIEKDFWVCWSLRRLFSLDEFRDHLTFKGGTTLSKVYQVIPPQRIVGLLTRDYAEMRPMFFREPPPLEQILAYLPELENRINGTNG